MYLLKKQQHFIGREQIAAVCTRIINSQSSWTRKIMSSSDLANLLWFASFEELLTATLDSHYEVNIYVVSVSNIRVYFIERRVKNSTEGFFQ